MSEIIGFRYRLIILAVAVSLFSGLTAQSLSVRDLQRLTLPLTTRSLQNHEHNPATMVARDSVSISSFAVGSDVERQEKAVMEQQGDGHDLFSISADSYTRLGSESAVWGSASFVTGSYHSVRWTDCIDYVRVAPYVLGDEAGGDLSTRCYRFSGGYAHDFDRWSVGVQAAYRAEIAYRNRDPRVKTVVSDLDISLGGAYNVGSGNVIGLKAGINVYSQNCDLDFYNPLNEINTYTLTGMGTYYKRFMGNANKNSGYSSFGYDLGLQWLPLEKSGLSVTVGYAGYRMEQQLRNYNNLTLGYTDNDILDWNIAYRVSAGDAVTLQPAFDGGIYRRKGTENLFGSSAGSSYDRIGSISPYSHDVSRFRFSVPMQFGKHSRVLTLSPSVAYESDEERYSDPLRKQSVSHIIPGLQADFSSVFGQKWLWNASVCGSYAKVCQSESILTDLDTATALGQCVVSNYSMLSADRLRFGADVGLSRTVLNFILSLKVGYRLTDFRGEGLCHGMAISLAAEF